MADKSSTGAVHLTTLDFDISGIQESLQKIREEVDNTASYVRESMGKSVEGIGTGTTEGGFSEGIKKEAEETEKAITITRKSIRELIGQFLSLEKRTESFRATGGGFSETFSDIRSEIQRAYNILTPYADSNEKVIEISKEEKQEIDDLRESLVKYSNQIKESDNDLIKSGESLDKQKNKIANLASSYDKLLVSLSKSGFDVNFPDFKKLQSEATTSAESARQLYNTVKDGTSITDTQAKQFSDLGRTLSDIKTRFDELNKTAELTGKGLEKIDEKAPDFNKTIKSLQTLESQYRQIILSMEKDQRYTSEVFGVLPDVAKDTVTEITGLTDEIRKNGEVSSTQAKRVNKLGENYRELRNILLTVKEQAERTGEGLRKTVESPPDLTKFVKSIETLNLQYKNFQNTLAKSKLDDSIGTPLDNIKQKTNVAAKSMSDLVEQIKKSGPVTQPQVDKFNELSSTLNTLKGELKDAETNAITTGEGFKTLGEKAKNASSGISDFLVKLSDKVKWMAAYQLIMLVENAIMGIVDTIKTTEDSVVELQRVLNENISAVTISDELNNIAYEFGQSFENVADVAVRFAQTGKSWNEVIDSTRATMLGLNTAELEVTTATEGLIAVMAQFSIPASELESVIDKINITADNFPVTSEKIVAALQRAGGTAAAFNMTLEETIATITTLAEKTGKSGESIGTGLNSLIIFTSKADNLKAFSKLSEQMNEVVQDYEAGATSIVEVWKQLSVELEKLSEQQKDALFDATTFEEFKDQFEAEAADYAAGIKQIYGSAGAYRQNLLTVLLQDASKIDEVMQTMLDAEGYSLAENARYMETLSAKVEQLGIAWRDLAVQFGNSMFLDILKGAVELATAILRITKELGGLNSLVILFATSLLHVKANAEGLPKILQKIQDAGTSAFQFITSPIRGAISAIKLFRAECNNGKTAVQALQAVMSQFKATVFIDALGAGLFLLNLVITKIREYRQEQARLREETISRGNEANEAANNIYTLYDAYVKVGEAQSNGTGSQRAYQDATNALKTALAEQGIEVESLSGDYDTLSGSIKEASLAAMQSKLFEQTEQIGAARDAIVAFAKEEKNLGAPFYNWNPLGTDKDDFEFAMNAYDKLGEKLKAMQEEGLKAGKSIDEIISDEAYENVAEYYYAMKPLVDQLEKAQSQAENTKEQMDNMANGTMNATNATDELGDSISTLTDEELEALIEKVEALEEAFDNVSGKIDSFQSAYSSMLDIIEEYNETGILTADMLQTILEMEPEYIQMLSAEGEELSLNEEAVNDLISANDDYLKQLAALKIATEAERIATEMAQAATDGLTASEYLAGYTAATLGSDIYKAALEMINGTGSAEDFAAALDGIASSAKLTGEWADIFTSKIFDMAKALGSLLGLQKEDEKKVYYSPPPAKSGKSAAEKALDAEKKKVKELISLKEDEIYFMEKKGATAEEIANKYIELQAIVHNQANKYRKMGYDDSSEIIRDLQKDWWKYQEEKAKAYKEENDAIIKNYENEIYFLEKKERISEDANANTQKQLDIYRQMQQQVHETANKYRELGYDENSEYIVALQKKWWDLEESIEKVVSGIYDKSVEAYQNAIQELEFNYNRLEGFLDYSGMTDNLEKQLDYYKKIQQEAEKEYERLIAKGLDINDDAVQTVVKDWRDAYNSAKDINGKMADDIIERYEEFISLADSFDVWDDLDISKLDYLKKEMSEINRLFEEGSIPLAKYKDLLEDLGKSYLDTKIDELEKQQDEIKENTDRLVKSYEAQIDRINQQKDASDKYYDDLIANLNKQEESNDRINAQLDYYANRQKVLRNLEQAQARSGVEWREKEIEYQEELANLDEDWRRTQEEWNISDQIEALEKLKQEASDRFEESIARIEDYIKKAEEESETAIESIEEEMEALKKKIYEAITEELEKAQQKAEEMKKTLSTIGDSVKPSIQELAKLFDELMDKLEDRARNLGEILSESASKGVRAVGNVIQNVANTPKKELVTGGVSTITAFRSPVSAIIDTIAKTAQIQKASKDILDKTSSLQKQDTGNKLLDTVKKIANSVLSLPKQIQERMKSETSAQAISNASNTGGKSVTATTNKTSSKSTEQNTNQTINVFANVPQENVTGTINSMVNQFSDFLLHPFKR